MACRLEQYEDRYHARMSLSVVWKPHRQPDVVQSESRVKIERCPRVVRSKQWVEWLDEEAFWKFAFLEKERRWDRRESA